MLPLFLDRDLGRKLPEAPRLMGVEAQAHRERYPDESVKISDETWIAEVAAAGFVIVTHDSGIRRRRGEWDVFQAAGARCFVLATNRPHRFTHLRALMIAWDEIESLVATEHAPFMYGLDALGRMRRYVGPRPGP